MTLTERYEQVEGEVFLTGLQALVRLPMEQHRRDGENGLRTSTLISGYEGSPLGGLDLELSRQRTLLDEHDIVFMPNVNEELAANAVQGSQLASQHASRKYDGVVGIWYGKAPGLDRATDAMRHGNLGGAAESGGVLVLVGDDSTAKSSTVPSSSEVAMAELGMPILVPSDPEEILTLGLHGIALSRYSGLWVGIKLATNVVDGSASTSLAEIPKPPVIADRVIDGREFHHEVSAHFLHPALAELERTLVNERLELAARYAVANGLASVMGDPNGRIGIVAAGMSFRDTMQALARLGVAAADLPTSGVRILKLDQIYPLDRDAVGRFAIGLDEVIVVEEKRAFIELAVKDALYGRPEAPAVYGRRGPNGGVLLRSDADLPPEYLAAQLGPILARHLHVQIPETPSAAPRRTMLPMVTRTPYFCSGCPHNRSTVVPDGSLVGAGIGCSALAALMPETRVGEVIGFTQMGGEGGSWIGMAPFVTETHLFQNMGDGTFHHSGILAIRAAIAAGTHVTYKLLYNDAVAMTGGQAAVGRMDIPHLIRELLAEGVQRIAITTEDPKRYRRVKLPRGVRVFSRDRLLDVQEELAAIEGVTVLIHDQECATELRRKRKRGKAPDPVQRAFINERVCEGCGDCGQVSNCMSVQPVETPFGRKTRIDQSSCNKDFSCLEGDCPSFVTVTTRSKQKRNLPARVASLPNPVLAVDSSEVGVRITGVGGTGVVTVAQVLATAASFAGLHVRGLDQLGMAQKGGAVVSDIKFSQEPIDGTNKLAPGECDLYLGCDVLVASDSRNLTAASSERTIAVVSTTQVPTGPMILDPTTPFPDVNLLRSTIGASSRADLSRYLDARAISERDFGSQQYANMLLLGVAVQVGALPIAPEHIDAAIDLNGVAVETNKSAFRRGRELALEPEATDIGVRREGVAGYAEELTEYQNARYAARYIAEVERFRLLDTASGSLTEEFARQLFKLMAYKDEYEVARLSLAPEFVRTVEDSFGAGARVAYRLHPPILRAMGMRQKLELGPWFKPAFRVLRAMRKLRGTPLDVFGYASVRRLERALIDEYLDLAATAMAGLTSDNVALVHSVIALPDLVRGYESIKVKNVERFREQASALLTELHSRS